MSPRIIPPTPPFGTPESELQFYRMLQECPGLDEWTIIHSSGHQGAKSHREIDFLALIPRYGILCIEVKGGGYYVRDGQWRRWHDGAPVESPARQSEQGMYALQKELEQQYGAQSRIAQTPSECLVVFPDATWPGHVRRSRQNVIDRDDIEDGRLSTMLTAAMLRLRPRTGARSKLPSTTPDIIAELRHYLAPDFDLEPAARKSCRPAYARVA